MACRSPGLVVKVTTGFYMIGLSNLDADKERNLGSSMSAAGSISRVYSNNRRAVLTWKKAPGQRGVRRWVQGLEAISSVLVR